MTPQQFVAKWRSITLKEKSAAQEHFIDLCHLVGHPTPADPRVQAIAQAARELVQKRDTWLALTHEKLDRAVFAAYGWPYPLSDEEILERLLALNLERAKGQGEVSRPVNEGQDEE